MRRFFVCVVGVIALAAPAGAGQDERPAKRAEVQQAKPTDPAQPKPKSSVPAEETPKTSPVPMAEPWGRGGQLANVRLEVTISDQRASGPPTTKTVALVLADRANGRIRTTGEVRVPRQAGGASVAFDTRIVVLNVDAQPEFTRDGRVRAHVTLEYKPVAGEAVNEEQALTTISESFAVILEDGKPLVVSQSADPTTDRRVRVEVKATILK